MKLQLRVMYTHRRVQKIKTKTKTTNHPVPDGVCRKMTAAYHPSRSLPIWSITNTAPITHHHHTCTDARVCNSQCIIPQPMTFHLSESLRCDRSDSYVNHESSAPFSSCYHRVCRHRSRRPRPPPSHEAYCTPRTTLSETRRRIFQGQLSV